MVGDGGGCCRVAYLKWNQFINPAAATIIITVSWPARANHPWEGLFIYPVYVDDGVGGWPLISVNKTNIHRIWYSKGFAITPPLEFPCSLILATHNIYGDYVEAEGISEDGKDVRRRMTRVFDVKCVVEAEEGVVDYIVGPCCVHKFGEPDGS